MVRENLKTNETMDANYTADKSLTAAEFKINDKPNGEARVSLRISNPSEKGS